MNSCVASIFINAKKIEGLNSQLVKASGKNFEKEMKVILGMEQHSVKVKQTNNK